MKLVGHALLVAALALVWAQRQADAHEWYTGLRGPTGAGCCNDRDCAPVPSRLTETYGTEVLIRGQWWDAFDPRWYLPGVVAPPDADEHDWHGCMLPSDPHPRCTMGPATGT